MSRLMQALDENFPKSNNVVQGTHKLSVHEEKPSNNKNILVGFDSHSEESHGWLPKGIHLPMIDMRKFDGKDPIAWIFQMEKFSYIDQMPTLENVTISPLYL